jgi:hypothetical protein
MSGAIHPFPQYAFMAWCLVKHSVLPQEGYKLHRSLAVGSLNSHTRGPVNNNDILLSVRHDETEKKKVPGDSIPRLLYQPDVKCFFTR